MDLKIALTNGIEIEELAGQVFHHLHQVFADDPEASAVFAKMSQEEEGHAAVFRRQLSAVSALPEAYVAVDEAVYKQQRALITQLQGIIEEIEHHPLSMTKAIAISMQVEEEVEDVHEQAINDLLQTSGKLSLATVAFEAITFQEGPDHAEPLFALARTRGITTKPSHER